MVRREAAIGAGHSPAASGTMAEGAQPWRALPDGVELAVRLTPRGGAPRIEGVADADGQPCLKVRVAAPPVDGAANAELVAFLARSRSACHAPPSRWSPASARG